MKSFGMHLNYYSPYFDRCFNGAFKEAVEQKLELPEDNIDDFEILIEFMLSGCRPNIKAVSGEPINVCMDFIAYADKYARGGIFCELLYGKLEVNLAESAIISLVYLGRFKPSHVELVLRVTKAGSPLRTLVVRDVLSSKGLMGMKKLKRLERETPEFAYEMLQQIRKSIQPGSTWADQLSDKTTVV